MIWGVCTWPECTDVLLAWLPVGTLGVIGVISNGNMRGPEVEAPIRVLLMVLALVLLWSCSNFHFCRSVARCEALVKKQYSFLGWEYTEPDSDDDQNATGCGEVSSITEKLPASLDANFSAIFLGSRYFVCLLF